MATRRLSSALVVALGSFGIDAGARGDVPTEAQLDALLAANPKTGQPVAAIAELVPLLSDELRQNFTFVYASRSPFAKSITPAHPRVIMFSEDASFIATFIGDPTAPGHDILETMRFDRATARWGLRARVLPAAGAVDSTALNASCARCHGEDPRPIYDSYPVWPGFYGSVEDSFPKEVPASRTEHARYLDFLHGEAQHGVYRALRYIKGSTVTPYMDPRSFDLDETRAAPETLRYQPNTRLGMALTELNRKRIYRKLSAATSFSDDAPAFLALLLGCDDTQRRADAAIRDAANQENTQRLLRMGVDPMLAKTKRFQMQELDQITNLTAIDRVAILSGVGRSDWSMAVEPSSLSYYDGILSGMSGGRSYYLAEDLLFEILQGLAARDARYAKYFRVRPSFPALGYPFGNKLDLTRARRSCAELSAR